MAIDRSSGGDKPSATSAGQPPPKLKYIMTFEPPAPNEKQETKTQTRPAAIGHETPQSAPPTKSAAKPAAKPAGKTQGRQAVGSPVQEISVGGDFTWPSQRTSPSYGTDLSQEENRRSRGGKGKTGAHLVAGIVKRHPDGYGFLVPNDSTHPDVYIPRQSMVGIMTNDRVEVDVFSAKGKREKEERLSGEIRRVISRANKTVVGKYLPVDRKYGVILDENRGWGADLRIATEDSMGAEEGKMVAVQVIQYPGEDRQFTGKVVDIIGDVENPINDVIRVVHQQGIPLEFSKRAVAEARKFGGEVTDAEMRGREDLTQLNLITIDGATAKDFDDAIYVEENREGFQLIVAIADVSHYVKPGTPLDEEAYERGTSTYFPNFVVPMLPEELSNELCSLKPHVKRLCFACEMHISFTGDVNSYRFFEGVMESKARVTYGEAQEVIDLMTGADKGRKIPEHLIEVRNNIMTAADLAKILMAKRFEEGSLDLEIPETQVVVDTTGESTDIIRSERIFAHRLIEELMLITNICTARFMDENELPGIYRIHEEPDPENIRALQRYMWNLGGSKSVLGGNLQKKLTKALQSMEGRPEAQILNILTLRTMQQARYSSENLGHFGLGFSHYSHFTSPIRRYPDLIAHRLIKSRLYPRYESMEMAESDIATASTFLSACEQRSTKAERKVISIKKARFMRKFIGEEFEGIVSSVAKFGVFVLLRQYDVDGLVKIENLGNDRFIFDEENLRLVGNRTGRKFAIGDILRVIVTGTDPEQGKIDFELGDNTSEDGTEDEAENAVEGVDEFGDPVVRAKKSRRAQKNKDQKESARSASSQGQSQGKSRAHSKAQPKAQPNAKKSGRKTEESVSATFKSEDSKKKQVDVQKRGETQDDRWGVRKERVSKRRRKN